MNDAVTSDDDRNPISDAQRKQRRHSIRLIVVSGIFVAIGLLMAGFTGSIVGVFIAIFFAAGIITGAMQLVGPDTRAGRLLAIIGAFVLAAACALLVVLTLAGVTIDVPGRSQPVAAIAAAVGVVFFGGGIALVVRFVRSGT